MFQQKSGYSKCDFENLFLGMIPFYIANNISCLYVRFGSNRLEKNCILKIFSLFSNSQKHLPNRFITVVWLFTIANVGHHHSLKKIFLGFYKNSFRSTPIIFLDTPKSFGQKDFKPDSVLLYENRTESGFVCLILSYNHRQRKSRNLSYTNQFNSRRSLTSTKKSTKK